MLKKITLRFGQRILNVVCHKYYCNQVNIGVKMVIVATEDIILNK